ncbi:MAG: glycosyltransferase family 39 protein [Anaerolineae bacterium]|nr:glycosyltransferase family 39 protein [Anaerolineae bacterium]
MTVTLDSPTPAVPNSERTQARLRPRRTLERLALASLGVAIGAAGQYFFGQDSLWDGLFLYGVAVILFVRALSGHLPRLQSPEHYAPGCQPTSLNLRGGWRRNVGIWLIVLAVGISFISLDFFGREDARQQAWWLYLVSLGLFVGGMLLLARGDPWRKELLFLFPHRRIMLGLALVVGLALLMRLYHFPGQPFGIWFDEAEAGLQARRMLQEPGYRPVLYAPINITGHQLATYALALRWLGNTIYAMRLVSVLFGVGGVLAAYLFGRQAWGPRFGLLLAFLVAAARWHVNFSRIAMTGIDTPFFEFLSLFFLTRLWQRGRLRDAMWAGLTLGLGLVFYTAFRLYVLAVVLFALLGILLWWRWLVGTLQNGGWLAQLGRVLTLVVAAWLVVMPVVKFALDNPDAFWYRTRQISVFNRRDHPDILKALSYSTGQHLLMFNYQGDNNGRHNLPGQPMLDPAMAVFLVLGFGLAVVRPRYPAHAFFLLLLPVSLAGGILAVDFEAPQSLRSIAVIPAVIYLAGLSLTVLGREAERTLKPLPKAWLVVPTAALAGFVLVTNAYTYFGRQANNFASWNAFSTPETIVGRKMAKLGPGYSYFISPFLANHPSLDFLAPAAVDRHVLNLPDALPIRMSPHRPVTLFIHPDDVWIFDEAQTLYPNATFYTVVGWDEADEGPPVVYIAELQPADVASVQGLELRYWPDSDENLLVRGPEPDASPLQIDRVLYLNTTWPDESPVTGDFVAEWSGILYAPQYGSYNLRLVTPGPAYLEIDGYPVFDRSQGEQVTGLVLPQGNHTLRLRAKSAPGQVALYWQPPAQSEAAIPQWALYTPPITNHGLLGTFYPNDHWEGQPALQRVDPFLDTYFHFIPLNRPYTVEWVGWLDVPQAGLYQLGLRAVPEAQLFLDGQLLVTTMGLDEYTQNTINLDQGLHDIMVRFRDNVDRSRLHLYWGRPDGRFGPIPSNYLWPPLGQKPEPSYQAAPVNVSPVSLSWVTTLGGPGQKGLFFEPRDVAVLPNDNLVVADTGNRWVQIVGPDGTFIQGLTGGEFSFEEPLAVGVNSQGEILALDSSLQWIYRYDAAGNLVERFGGPTAYFFHPRGMTIFEDDTIAVADTGSARLTLFNGNGSLMGNIGQLGDGPGQLNEPTDVLRDSQGTYFVAEAMNHRIQHLGPGGNFLNQWAIPPAYAYNGPHLAFGPDGSIFVTESQSRSLMRYAPDGALLDHWQTIGPANLIAPVGIYFDPRANYLYITDVQTHQIHVFAVQQEDQ